MSGWPAMGRRGLIVVALGLVVSFAPAPLAALKVFLPAPGPGVILPIPLVPLNERLIHIPVSVSSATGVQRLRLEATLYRPPGPGPFPLLILSHGTPRNPRRRAGARRLYDGQSWEFVSLGFAVVIPMRRGYGHSQGSYAESEGPCDRSNFYKAGLESARDLRATLEYVSSLPGIDAHRLVLAGYSSGGFASLILAGESLPGVRGVINFSGGRGSKAGLNCSPDRLIAACARAGRGTRVPTLWLYAKNDSYFPPRLAREMCAAYQHAGGRAEFVMLPPFYPEGHYFFPDVRGLGWWTAVVNRFLNDLGFPGRMPRP